MRYKDASYNVRVPRGGSQKKRRRGVKSKILTRSIKRIDHD